jgi:hypothetical protein
MVAHDDTGKAFGPVEMPLDPQELLKGAIKWADTSSLLA